MNANMLEPLIAPLGTIAYYFCCSGHCGSSLEPLWRHYNPLLKKNYFYVYLLVCDGNDGFGIVVSKFT